MSAEFRHRLARRLEWQRALNDPTKEPRNRLPTLAPLRQWQSRRLAQSFKDFLANPAMRPAAEFFLSDLYADRDFSARDRDAARVLPMMSRFLPDSLLRAATDAIELAVLSHALDMRMAEHLATRPNPNAAITVADYTRAYQHGNYRRLRQHQIELVLRVGHALDAAVKKHGVYKLLRAARIPAQSCGPFPVFRPAAPQPPVHQRDAGDAFNAVDGNGRVVGIEGVGCAQGCLKLAAACGRVVGRVLGVEFGFWGEWLLDRWMPGRAELQGA